MANKNHIVIESIGSVSPLGSNTEDIVASIDKLYCQFENLTINDKKYPLLPIHKNGKKELKEFLILHPEYKKADRSVQLALLASNHCLAQMIEPEKYDWTINAGSSRGATGTWENNFRQFNADLTVPVKSSPQTTLGNISSSVAQHFKLKGFLIDHSITCSSGLQALANGIAWLKSGLAEKFLAIGTEAPLTPFTVAQMAALGIYSKEKDSFPCKPCLKSVHKTNTFVLGEAAVSIAMSYRIPLKNELIIAGMGTASEQITNPTSISDEGIAFKESMRKAIAQAGMKPNQVDVIIPHSPGTHKGDLSEKAAIESILGSIRIPIINHKFLTGHTLGASGLLGVELASYLIHNQIKLSFPYPSLYPKIDFGGVNNVLINAMGFGGNAVSIMVKKV